MAGGEPARTTDAGCVRHTVWKQCIKFPAPNGPDRRWSITRRIIGTFSGIVV